MSTTTEPLITEMSTTTEPLISKSGSITQPVARPTRFGGSDTNNKPTVTTIEPTNNPITTQPPPQICVLGTIGSNKLKHIISKDSGSAYNIEYITPQTFMIYQKPFRTGDSTLVLSMSNGNLYNSPKDDASNRQRWIMTPSPNGNKYVIPYLESGQIGSSQSYRVLQYDNGYLSLRPKSNNSGQMWIYNDTGPIDYGVKSCTLINDNVQNNNIENHIENKTVHNQYINQLGEMLNLIQTNLAHYNNALSGKSDGSRTISSVFGNGQPIKLTVDVSGVEKAEAFNEVKKDSVLDLLNKYENHGQIKSDTRSDLQKDLYSKPKCKSVNLKDYVDRRVGQCNCDLTGL